MKKVLAGLVSGIALMGLAACGENADDTTTQGIEQDQTAPVEPAPTEPAAPDTGTTPDTGGAGGGMGQ